MNVIYDTDWEELDEQNKWFAYLQQYMEQKGGEDDARSEEEGNE